MHGHNLGILYIHAVSETKLSDGHFPLIYEKLRRHASNWQDIGTGLRFTSSELKNVQSQPVLLNGAPYSYLWEMLSQWLQWAPGDARGSTEYATLEALKSAVDKAGLGRAAQEFTL